MFKSPLLGHVLRNYVDVIHLLFLLGQEKRVVLVI